VEPLSGESDIRLTQREVKLRRGMGLAEATLIGVGAMVGAGIFVLTGIAAGAAGPALMLAFLLNGIIALSVAASYAELGSTFPQAGGSYAWAKLALPSPFGFLAGWMSWFGSSVACSLYALAFGAYLTQLLHSIRLGVPLLGEGAEAKLFAVIIVLVFTAINYRGSAETGKAGNIITLGQTAVLFVFVVAGLWALRGAPDWSQNLTPVFPKGVAGLLTAMGLTFVAFEGYEIIAQCGEEVREPHRNVPRAIFLSVVAVIPVYVLIAFTMLAATRAPAGDTVWQYLGQHAELAVLESARQFAPGGIILLLLGGFFATTSALNATLYSASRVSFAMGRDFNLPGVFALIHRRTRTPHGAIFASAAGIVVMAVALPLEDVASATCITFMVLFAMMNLAVVALRYQRPGHKRGFRVPLSPWIPLLSTVCLIALAANLFHFSSTAWFVIAGWVVLGLIVYREYAGKREREERGPRVVLEERTVAPMRDPVLVALANPDTVEPLMRIGCALARHRSTSVVALHVVQIPRQLPTSESREFLDRAEPLFEAAAEVGGTMEVPVLGSLCVCESVHSGVLEAIAEKRPSLLLMGWRGGSPQRRRLLGTTIDPVLRASPADTLLLHWHDKKAEFGRVLVGVTASPHARFCLEVAEALHSQLKSKLRYLHVIRRGTPMDDATEKAFLRESPNGRPALDLEIVQARTTAGGIVEAAMEADLLILGAAREGLVSQLIFGEKTRRIARRAPCSVLLARRRPGAGRSLLRRLFTKQT
jgi:amino acid transporter/nucleotide-binding universal stress UspA family protein